MFDSLYIHHKGLFLILITLTKVCEILRLNNDRAICFGIIENIFTMSVYNMSLP